MKKTASVILVLLLVCLSLTGCGKSLLGNKVKVYVFNGETGSTDDRNIKITNGVIVLAPKEYMFREGEIEGDLKPKDFEKDENFKCSVTYWYRNSDSKEEVISMFSADISDESNLGAGTTCGGEFADIESLNGNFYCRIAITNPDGTVDIYEIPLVVEEITHSEKA